MRRKRFILRHGGVRPSTPHSSGFVRLASGAFYFVVAMMTFYEFINLPGAEKSSPGNCRAREKAMGWIGGQATVP